MSPPGQSCPRLPTPPLSPGPYADVLCARSVSGSLSGHRPQKLRSSEGRGPVPAQPAPSPPWGGAVQSLEREFPGKPVLVTQSHHVHP